eukprot:m.201241 g.201241  ORF g.201241 m.201241 type:complete len:115 (+) comp16863_c1_seq1:738-1082(+)
MGQQDSYLGMTALQLPAQQWLHVRAHFVGQLARAMERMEISPVNLESEGHKSVPSLVSIVPKAKIGLCQLLEVMWSTVPSERPSAYDVVRLPFLDERFMFKAQPLQPGMDQERM